LCEAIFGALESTEICGLADLAAVFEGFVLFLLIGFFASNVEDQGEELFDSTIGNSL
jgi:hypothetical protein